MSIECSVAVFDLDGTLWDGNELFPDVPDILENLAESRVPVYLASFNTCALEVCKILEIEHYFEQIIYGRDKSKLEMLKIVMGFHPDVPQHQVVFYDDDPYNITEVKKNSNITAIHTAAGIHWGLFDSGFPDFF